MKPRKLTPRIVIVAIVILGALYYLFPTFRYESLSKEEAKNAVWLAEEMGIPLEYVIENLNRDESILRDKLDELTGLGDVKVAEISEKLSDMFGEGQDLILKYRKKAIKRGLDLQGGMHLVLEVDITQLLSNLARQHDANLKNLLRQIDEELTSNPKSSFDEVMVETFNAAGVRLSQYYGEAGESDAIVLSFLNIQAEDAINRSLEILRNRIDQFGVSEPSIQKQGSRRIVLELPGVQDPNRARDLIGRTALLEFKLLADPEVTQQIMKDIDAVLAMGIDTDKGLSEDVEITDDGETLLTDDEEFSPEEETTTDDETLDFSASIEEDAKSESDGSDDEAVTFDSEEAPFTSLLRGFRGDIAIPAGSVKRVKSILVNPKVVKLIPNDSQFLWSAKPEPGGDGEDYLLLYYVKSEAELTGSALSDASVDISSGYNNPGTAGQSVVSLELNRKGARHFSRITGANIGKRLAIVLDDKVYMAPNIRSKIPNGRAVIEGSGSIDEAKDIAIVLRAGALPTSVIIEEERTVGPSLGRDSIRKGTFSAISGMAVVVLFMIFYYGLSGIIASIALLLNIFLIFAGLAFFGAMGMGATLSLPGIAGIILTIGMAVDANVLIFERIREELRTGKTVWHAISAGYDRAFITILDANLTTLIAALVLLQFGSGPIKGFAVTLSIGILSSLFTSIVVTRLIFDIITSKRKLERLSI